MWLERFLATCFDEKKGWCFLWDFLSWAVWDFRGWPHHSLGGNFIPIALKADIAALLADPFRAALASGEADTKPAMHDWVRIDVCVFPRCGCRLACNFFFDTVSAPVFACSHLKSHSSPVHSTSSQYTGRHIHSVGDYKRLCPMAEEHKARKTKLTNKVHTVLRSLAAPQPSIQRLSGYNDRKKTVKKKKRIFFAMTASE
jgi:hypothetical protein